MTFLQRRTPFRHTGIDGESALQYFGLVEPDSRDPLPSQLEATNGQKFVVKVCPMTIQVLDPDAAFERASRHWRRCKRCRDAGAERANLKDLCVKGRKLMTAWDETERIYDTAKAA
jgi:hypothetical protein